jgi:hypothetical protein
METLANAAARLRAAVASQSYAQARRLVPSYCAALEREFGSHASSSPEARQIAEEARDLYQWLARTVILDRAQCVTALRRLANLSSYLRTGSRKPQRCDCQG